MYAMAVGSVVGVVWMMAFLVAPKMENIRVVEVKPGVECAVTSRMFNTSIDCWKTD